MTVFTKQTVTTGIDDNTTKKQRNLFFIFFIRANHRPAAGNYNQLIDTVICFAAINFDFIYAQRNNQCFMYRFVWYRK